MPRFDHLLVLTILQTCIHKISSCYPKSNSLIVTLINNIMKGQ
ncbi:9425_t:CDS:2 [Rhizophagus irregularis]|nr:9425_t:CDS:2 [Rhizophagus irregularis]